MERRCSLASTIAVLVLVAFVAAWRDRRVPRWLRGASIALTLALVTANTIEGRFTRHGFNVEHWPDWREEVRRWRSDHRHPLRIWPPLWTMNLDR